MARRPDVDECLVVNPRSEERGERVWVQDLARYLDCQPGFLRKWAKKHGFLRFMGGVDMHDGAGFYVSPHGARHLILMMRAIQGERLLPGGGRDWWVRRASKNAKRDRGRVKER